MHSCRLWIQDATCSKIMREQLDGTVIGRPNIGYINQGKIDVPSKPQTVKDMLLSSG